MSSAQLFIEVECEELPAGWGALACEHLALGLGRLLEGIPSGAVRTWSTPRRVAVAIDDVALARPLQERLITGPPADRAFKDGQPTKAAEGFARGRGVAVTELEIVAGPKGDVVAIRLQEGGGSTLETVAAGLEEAILGVPFPRTMRWGEGEHRWARPIHRVCAILGGERVAASVAGQTTVNQSAGHRFRREPFAVACAEQWVAELRSRWVMADAAERRAVIERELRAAAAAHGVELLNPEELLDEVTDLVEWPVVVVGTLAERFMDLPPRLLTESMKVHQRVFPSQDAAGNLTSLFLAVSNNPLGDAAVISAGNVRVLAARFSDARFFFDEDLKQTLEQHGEGLARMRWVRGLGTVADKQERLAQLAVQLAAPFGASSQNCVRAAALCKADLTTQLVGEFPELQGHVGMLYARHQGEPATVAQAIEDHYRPRFAGDALPQAAEGRVLALADRLDTLAGCFAIGLIPRGSADPQGLRRAANGVVSILTQAEDPVSLSLAQLFQVALALHAGVARRPLDELGQELTDFVLARFRAQQLASGVSTEVVDAVLAAGGDDLQRLARRVDALLALSRSADFEPIRVAFRRVMGLSREHASTDYQESALHEPAERALHLAVSTIRRDVDACVAGLDYPGALQLLIGLKGPVDNLFDAVLVMADDEAVRTNRLGLLKHVAEQFAVIADFSRLSAVVGG